MELVRMSWVSSCYSPKKLCSNVISNWSLHFHYRHKSHYKPESADTEECCKIMNVHNDYNLSQLRESYIKLAKKYHPDGATSTADAKKFADVEMAYRVLKEKFIKEREVQQLIENEPQEKDYGIKHTTPQHRHFLSFDGVGYGNMMQRQKQYQQYKVTKAVDAVLEHRTQKLAVQQENTLVVKDKKEAKKHKPRNAIDRLVEDLIQESMSRGDFDNLPGKGKPLKPMSHNPYIDTITHKLNEVLINNGFTPQWILLEKDIRSERMQIKEKLKFARSKFGAMPLSNTDLADWSKEMLALQDDVDSLNAKINNYNLLVPILEKQMVNFCLAKEAEKVLHCDVGTLATLTTLSLDKNHSVKAPFDQQAGLIQLVYEMLH